MKHIYLFTSNFPFGKGENFIEDEVLIAPDNNYRVTIIPMKRSGSIRKIPDFIAIDSSLANKFYRYIINTILSCAWIKELLILCKSSRRPHNIKEWSDALKYIIGSQITKLHIKTMNLKDGDILYSYWFNHIARGLIEGKSKYHSKKNIKIITRAHRYDLYEEFGTYFPFKKDTIYKLDKVFCISQDGYDYLYQKYNVNCLDVSRLGVWKPTLPLPTKQDSIIRIVSCSAISPIKRVDLIYKCIRDYAIQNPQCSLEWAHFGDGDLMHEIKKLCSVCPANLSVKLYGFVPKKEIMECYGKIPFDIFVNLSESEGIPVSIMEAMSYGIPTIATLVGGIPEILCDGGGIGIENSSEINNEFCKAVTEILDNKDKYSKAALLTFKDKYDASHNYTCFYKRLCNL